MRSSGKVQDLDNGTSTPSSRQVDKRGSRCLRTDLEVLQCWSWSWSWSWSCQFAGEVKLHLKAVKPLFAHRTCVVFRLRQPASRIRHPKVIRKNSQHQRHASSQSISAALEGLSGFANHSTSPIAGEAMQNSPSERWLVLTARRQARAILSPRDYPT
jgi:hypothetical protein